MKRLSEIKDGDWRGFRTVARRYERELRCIRNATACDAPRLRKIAEAALAKGKKQKHWAERARLALTSAQGTTA